MTHPMFRSMRSIVAARVAIRRSSQTWFAAAQS